MDMEMYIMSWKVWRNMDKYDKDGGIYGGRGINLVKYG